ncbi:MAG: formimidoylglutamate deiminase [Hyphomicrobiales bacterium]|nr:formimidoylglutamate deiminase [Hyphomicrobiales bacterium]
MRWHHARLPRAPAVREPASRASHRAKWCRTACRPRERQSWCAQVAIHISAATPIVEPHRHGARALIRELFFDRALLPAGWASDVRVQIEDGTIVAATEQASRSGAEHVTGIALPGLPNLHCHAFQRGMAALAERRGPASDSFWTWREVMYRFLGQLTPEHVEAIAAYAYMQMLETGFTAVGEFHYLHHDVDGRPYADIGEMAARIAAASTDTGITLTLLPSFYAYGGFGEAPPTPGQRRFLNDPDRFLRLHERSRAIIAPLPGARLGIAPHSLRAVTPQTLAAVCTAAPEGPIHIHAAEQMREVEDSVAVLGQRPVEWLLARAGVDARWCLVHATHMTALELHGLVASGAVAGLCPLTEASLGDGIFSGADYLAAGGRFGIGSDSNIQIDAAAELRQLEYGQRQAHRIRNVMTLHEGESTGRRLMTATLAGGAQALAQPIGALAPGRRADIVLLDSEHPDLVGRSGDRWLDAWIFTVGRAAVRTVIAGGTTVVEDGRHKQRDVIEPRYKRVLAELAER